MPGLKHLIECHCSLPIFNKSMGVVYHKFPVYSKLDSSDKVVTKLVQCNNCNVIHKVYDLCKSTVLGGKDELSTVMTLDDIAMQLSHKLANILRNIATNCPYLVNWDGDTSQSDSINLLIKPLMDETESVTREMVDNYIADIQVSITSKNTVYANSLLLNINISNYSTNDLNIGTIKPIFNDLNLSLSGMKPDVLYSFHENKFHVGEIKSYTEEEYFEKFGDNAIEVNYSEFPFYDPSKPVMRARMSECDNDDVLCTICWIDINNDDGWSLGRSYRDAPEVDNYVKINKKLLIGSMHDVMIKKAYEYDVEGEVING